jgi:hypothetical protein
MVKPYKVKRARKGPFSFAPSPKADQSTVTSAPTFTRL